ncbi:peptidase M16 domain protein [Kribbella flavida DSM 17836]|uniref:Peptidase M16 domain protein n=1 Tax=Kribbella flavida (strain DSM 17836 / JCM 10339 / NBRC 14399) TaxID=479435 RepID=D2PKM3_KRIFD|nr:insulinase family protein [Kribbella flavida]ADB30535.1 peptidase M16 domain protein [Kribbella flavida DSM 17836]
MTQSVNGVRLLHHREPQTFTDVTLTFAVGARDETLPTVGVAHALEHLVMSTVRRLPIKLDGQVDTMTTSFMASGSPARVGEFLNGVCAALAVPPVSRLPLEAGVLAAEDGWVTHPMAALLYYVRYGARGPGLAWLDGGGPDGLTGDQVKAFAHKWFTADNAVLQITGPVPDGLELALPAGVRPSHDRYTARSFDGPVAVEYGVPGAAVLLTLPDGDSARTPYLAIDVLQQRIEESCRHVGGHSYVVDSDFVHQPDGTTDWVLYAEAREGTDDAVARAVAGAVTDLAEKGPTDEELALAIARFDEELATTDVELRAEFARLRRELFDEPQSAPVVPEQVRAVRPAQIAAVLRAALPSAIGYASEAGSNGWTDLGFSMVPLCPVGGELPAGQVFRPPLGTRAFSREARSMTLVLTQDGLAVRDDEGVHSIPFDAVAGVLRAHDGTTVVFGANGCVFPVSADLYRGGAKVVAELTRRVDPALWYDESKFTAEED